MEVDKLAQLGRYQFECTRCSERELVAGGWTDPAGIKATLARIADEAGEETYGDVFGVLAD